MDRRSFLTSSALAGLAVGFAAHAADIATGTPTATIETLQEGLVAAASSESIDARYEALEPLIVATHDLPYIAEFALRRQWSSLSEADRQRFVDAFRRLSVMTYAARFKSIGPDTFRAISAAPPDASGRAQVSTAIARSGQPDVSLEYVLQQGEHGWRIVNVVADGVSDLALKRAEYQRVFGDGGIEALIAELNRQTDRQRQD